MMYTEVLEGHLIAQVGILLSIINITTYTILKNVFTSRQWYIKLKINSHYHRNKLIMIFSLQKVEHIKGPCYALTDFPAKGFAFQLNRGPTQLARY